jgi:hypothetical protein
MEGGNGQSSVSYNRLYFEKTLIYIGKDRHCCVPSHEPMAPCLPVRLFLKLFKTVFLLFSRHFCDGLWNSLRAGLPKIRGLSSPFRGDLQSHA